jgi:hypothetical protein
MVSGCASGTGSKWYAPTTWFSGSELRKVERVEAKRDSAREEAIKAAQETAYATQEALTSAPVSRPVEVAQEANGQTVALLDQVAGPLTVAEREALRKQVSLLLSENADLRKSGEALRDANREAIADISIRLANAQAELRTAQTNLKAGFARENALANQLRVQRFLLWAVGIVAVLGYAGILYFRIAYGGIPAALGRGLSEIRAKQPELAPVITQAFDTYLNRDEQARISRHA